MQITAHKSPEAFRTISEVAGELDVPQHVLRFWESKFGAVRPLKRGGGRRYYRPDDIDLLRGIRTLLYSEGLTIKGVQKILRQRGARYVADLGHQAVKHFDQLVTQVEAVKAAAAEPESNIRAFPNVAVQRPAEAEESGMTGEERAHFTHLLEELLELKTRLQIARRNIVQI
jgi:DNA-binding transcriptional MerR regulator